MAAVSSRRRALAALAVIALLTASGGVAADIPITPAQEAEARLARVANAVLDPASVRPLLADAQRRTGSALSKAELALKDCRSDDFEQAIGELHGLLGRRPTIRWPPRAAPGAGSIPPEAFVANDPARCSWTRP
jgi:hypothetical protein